MQLIQTVTVGSGGAANITFSSIPQTFTDLLILCSLSGSSTNPDQTWVRLGINGSTASTSSRKLFGTGSAAASDASADTFPIARSSYFGSASLYFPNYSVAAPKSASIDSVGEDNATKAYMAIAAFLYNSNTAITSIELTGAYNNLAQYSSASLYGITKGSSGGVTVS